MEYLFSYDLEKGELLRNVPGGRFGRFGIGSKAGWKDKVGYIHIRIDGRLYLAHRLIWLREYGYFPEYFLDHINQNPSDNRLKNLREVSPSCNLRNRGNPMNNTSGIKGVHWYKPTGKWKSQINVCCVAVHLGHYKSFDNAVCARLAGEQCVGWEGCDSNSPAYQYVQKNIIKKGDTL